MKLTLRGFGPRLLVCAGLALFAIPAAPGAAHANSTPRSGSPSTARIELPKGFQPEGIAKGRGTTIYAGSLANGAIWRGDASTGLGAVIVPGVDGGRAVGLDYEWRTNRLWVAGGPTGTVKVYDQNGAALATYTIPGAGFLNDLVVTRHAAYVTDSFVQRLVVIPIAKDGTLPPQAGVKLLPLHGDLAYTAGFNVNGISTSHDGKYLIVVQSSTSTLFRVHIRTGESRAIALTGGALNGGDGLVLDGRTLYVVRGAPNAVVEIKLAGNLKSGHIVRTLTDPGLDVPSTARIVKGQLLVVNARFGTPPGPEVPYWITRIPLGH